MDRDGGLRYCTRYLIRYILASMAVAAFLAYIALSISGVLWDDPWTALSSLIGGVAGSMSLKWALAGVPLIVMAFLVGANGKGTLARLSSRAVLNIYLAVLMVWVSSSPEYIFDTTVINDAVTVVGMTIGMDALPITLLLLVIPISSLIDAFLEYKEGRCSNGDSIHP